MSSSDDDEHSPSLADRLVATCWSGDLPSAIAAVADGASVNEKGRATRGMWLPLAASAFTKRHDVVVWLLSHGADPNGDYVMFSAAYHSTAATLQLVIDAGGDVNRTCVEPPLSAVVRGDNSEDNLRVLLAQPALDLVSTYDGETPEQYAHDNGKPALAVMMAQEVSWECLRVYIIFPACADSVFAVADRSRDERRWYDHCFVRLIADMYCAAGMRGFAVAAALWQSAEQRCREVEAADAAAVARLVRGVLCCRDPRNAPLFCVCPDSCVCWCCGDGGTRRVRVLESCEVPRCAV